VRVLGFAPGLPKKGDPRARLHTNAVDSLLSFVGGTVVGLGTCIPNAQSAFFFVPFFSLVVSFSQNPDRTKMHF
jgi:hypothetical protein